MLKLLCKGKKDDKELVNCRGIVLQDAASKLTSSVVAGRLEKTLAKNGIDSQFGCQAGHGLAVGAKQDMARRMDASACLPPSRSEKRMGWHQHPPLGFGNVNLIDKTLAKCNQALLVLLLHCQLLSH